MKLENIIVTPGRAVCWSLEWLKIAMDIDEFLYHNQNNLYFPSPYPSLVDIKSPQAWHESYMNHEHQNTSAGIDGSHCLLLRCAGKSGVMWLGEMTSENDTCLNRLLIYQRMCKYDIY